MRSSRILVVDDEPAIRQSLCGVLEDEGFQARSVASGEECLEELGRLRYDLVFLDIWLPGIDGLETLARIEELPPATRPGVVMISGHGNIETAVRATKLGAFDFLEKPLTIEKVLVVGKNAIQHRRLELELERFRESGTDRVRIIGESVPMKALRQQLALMAGTNGRVLIFGESGTGKELVAHAIHALSPRAAEPFVEVNCAAIPEELIESELFGHRKGSFTGAHEDKAGKFQKADSGTLFLDEVGDMSLKTQAKVLRALEEQRFEPVGASAWVQVDVRVIAATNKNLDEEIAAGRFREDLFYRLNVIHVHLPPLRERGTDVLLLANFFLTQFTRKEKRAVSGFSQLALTRMQEYPWPGNIRELKHKVHRAVILSSGPSITAEDLGFVEPQHRLPLQEAKDQFELRYITDALITCGGNISRAAQSLGVARQQLQRYVKKHGLNPGVYKIHAGGKMDL